MTGVDWRTRGTTVTSWPGEAVTLPGSLTYRGEHVRLGPPSLPAPSDLTITGADLMAELRRQDTDVAEHYFALVAYHSGVPVAGPAVVAVPGWFFDDPTAISRLHRVLVAVRFPAVRVVAAPVAAAAYAQLTGALATTAAEAPLVVCDLDGTHVTVTVMHPSDGQLRPDAAWIPAPRSPASPEAGWIGAEAVRAAVAAGLERAQLRLLVIGEPDLLDPIVTAAAALHGRAVTGVELRDPSAAVAGGAAAIAAGAATLTDSFYLGVQLPVHGVRDGELTEEWIDLRPGDGPCAREIDVTAGDTTVVVRLTATGERPSLVGVPAPGLEPGVYRLGVDAAEGLTLVFHSSAGVPVGFPVPVPSAEVAS